MVVLAVLAVVVVVAIAVYNGLVRLRAQADNAWADIDVQLKRRYDLVPNLVETVKGYAGHERGTLEAYPQLRAAENFAQLQTSLGQIEDAVQNARRYYNAVVRDLNTRIAQFPSNLIAGSFGFTPREFFELSSEAERQAPKVSFETAGR